MVSELHGVNTAHKISEALRLIQQAVDIAMGVNHRI
jgi:hypothetical protein